MKTEFGHVCMCVFSVMVVSCMWVQSTLAEDFTPQQLLARLRAKDQAFDNAELKYVKSGTVTVQHPWDWQSTGTREVPHRTDKKRRELRTRARMRLLVRGADTTFVRERDDEGTEDVSPGVKITLPFEKWSNAKGLIRELSLIDGMGGRGSSVLDIYPSGLPVDPVRHKRMGAEFAHGFGFGARIRDIEKITTVADGLLVRGSIRIWREDESTFELVLDSDLIVRRAAILSNVRGARTGFEISTSGTVGEEPLKIAAGGRLRRFNGGVHWLDGTNSTNQISLSDEYEVRFVELRRNLTDEYYEKNTGFDLRPGMQVIDRVAGETYFIGLDGRPESDRRRL